MIRDSNSFTIDSNLNFYRCYSLVGNNKFALPNYDSFLNSHLDNPLICNEINCEFYHNCFGGCPFKNYVKNGELSLNCNKNEINEINTMIFMLELKHIYKGDFNEEQNVSYFQINFK